MPANSPHHQTPERAHLPAPAAPVLTGEGLCSVCKAIPVLICADEVQICRNCFAVLWHMRRPAAPKQRPPAESKPASDAELAVPVPSARQRAIDAVVTSPEKSDRRIAAETGLDRATIARARGQLDEYQPVDMPRAETPQSSEPDPDPPREPALRDEKGRFVRPDIARIDAVSEPPGSDTLVPD